MKLEQQVVSLDLSKRLKELGVKQGESLFIIRVDGGHILLNKKEDWDSNREHYYSAFTVAELGEMLPAGIIVDKKRLCLHIWKDGDGSWWCVLATIEMMVETAHTFIAKTEAAARAKMLIYLIESKLV